MTQRQIGGYEFKSECVRVRNSATAIREALSRIIESNPGPQTLYMLTTKMAVEVGHITDAINTIEEIGADAKTKRT